MIYRPPHPLPLYFKPSGAELYAKGVFLAGSIEMGTAEDWQTATEKKLDRRGWNVFNPRRKEWDSSWEQSIDNPEFRGQVEWELDALQNTRTHLFYFVPGTMAPVTLMEFGLHAGRTIRTVVVCPQGFWRKGNVDIVCARLGIPQRDTLGQAIDYLGSPS